jgi:hypothetical protein
MQTMDAHARVLGIRYDGVTTKGMALIGQNNSQREEYMDHTFPCTPQGGIYDSYTPLVIVQEYTCSYTSW